MRAAYKLKDEKGKVSDVKATVKHFVPAGKRVSLAVSVVCSPSTTGGCSSPQMAEPGWSSTRNTAALASSFGTSNSKTPTSGPSRG